MPFPHTTTAALSVRRPCTYTGVRTKHQCCYLSIFTLLSLYRNEKKKYGALLSEQPSYDYEGISLLPTTYKILSNILSSRSNPYAEEITGAHQCGFRRNGLSTDLIFCIRPILLKKWEYNEAVKHLFIDFKKAYNSVRREILYNILIEICFPVKLVNLIKMCLNETYTRVRVGKHLSDMLPIKNGLKQGDTL